MEGKQKIAVIISNVQYEHNRQRYRKGGKKDAEDIRTALEKLNFNVKLHQDLSFTNLYDELRKLSLENHENTGCLVVVAMTHGHADKLEAYDDSYLTKQLWKFFVDDCATLNGKPKLFFIQACRGNNHDSGVSVQNMEKISGSEPVKITKPLEAIAAQDAKAVEEPSSKMTKIDLIGKSLEKQPSTKPPTIEDTKIHKIGSETEVETGDMVVSQTDSVPIIRNEATGYENDLGLLKIAIPASSDMLVMYSSTDGFPSWRNHEYGSCFIQTLCAELQANGDKKELLQMLTNVSRMVAYHFNNWSI
ncbi:caspase-like [Anopheles aquasalis]|uniref:caspase-like n=1 Tax=Anopheles aquasalis TaxID=42839 RepID=UPI00215B400A|nr:caspase-like [Anopheles aquasalis]